eukprot:PLAT11873.1.p1 GENE.PLAT11873.1~~PLAT11873.1.p1  ORF type:complete len:238 (-),score=101.22 PLAT11873.1:101-781(-)
MAEIAALEAEGKEKEWSWDGFRSDITESARWVLVEEMPRKILLMDELHTRYSAALREQLLASHDAVLTWAADEDIWSPEQLVVSPAVAELLELLKEEIAGMVEHLSTLMLWVRLQVPKRMDGDNFGVEVQTDALSMLNSGRLSGLAVLTMVQKFYHRRGLLQVKARRHPEIEDYRRALAEFDAMELANLVQTIQDLRNNYNVLYDRLCKNYSKISKPRSSRTGIMY